MAWSLSGWHLLESGQGDVRAGTPVAARFVARPSRVDPPRTTSEILRRPDLASVSMNQMKYEPPAFQKKAFTCPHCSVYAHIVWADCRLPKPTPNGYQYLPSGIHIASCVHCHSRTIWLESDGKTDTYGAMLWPFGISNSPAPHDEMPADVKTDYVEARGIASLSPRGAAALLRLAIQKLCAALGESGKDINADIGSMVRKGLPVQIQQALDVVRVTGNNAVHPGELRVEDNPEVVSALFGLLNMIVDNRIAEPKRIQTIYDQLPEGALRSIAKRDG